MNVNSQTLSAWWNNQTITTRVMIDGVQVPVSSIYEQSLEIEESVCDDNALNYVGCIPCSCKIKIRDFSSAKVGKSIEVYTKAGNTEEIPIFKGVIDEVTMDSAKEWSTIEAFDMLYTINNTNVVSWYNNLSFPITLAQFRNSFFAQFGVTQSLGGASALPNDNILIEKTIGGEEILGSDIIKSICQINAVFGIMNREGVFCYRVPFIPFATEESQVLYLKTQTKSFEFDDYITNAIDKIQIRSDAEDVGGIVGTGNNCYIIEGNILAYGKSSSELTTIAENIQDNFRQYRPFKLKTLSNPYIEVGNFISIDRYGKSAIITLMLSRKMSGFASLTDEITSKGVLNYEEAMTSTNDSLIQLRGQSNRLIRTVEGLTSEVTTIKGDYASKSLLEQTSESITAQINYIQSEIDGDLTMYYVKEPPTLYNYPAYDFTYNIICGVTQLTEGLKFEYNDDYYRKNIRNLAYDEVNYMSYRFVQQNGVWGWQEIADTEMGVVMQKISSLEMTADEIKASVSSIQTSYATKEELSSSISVSSDSILSTVSAKYTTKTTTSTLQSQVNQQADQISAKVSKSGGSSSSFGWNLTDSAFSLVSGNTEKFRCDVNGVMINGDITATSGKIGQWSVNSNGMFYQGTSGKTMFQADGNIVCYDNSNNVKWYLNCNGDALFSGYATTNELRSNYATITQLNGVNAKFNTLNASNITTGTLSVARLNITDIMVNMAGKSLGVSELTAGSVKAINALLMTYNTRQIQVYADATGYMKWRYT